MGTAKELGFGTNSLEGEVVFVFAACVLGDPEHDNGEHEGDALRHIRISVICELFRVSFQDIFQHQDGLYEIQGNRRSEPAENSGK